MIAKTNAANYLVRSSLENMRSTRGQHHGHTMLEAATQGAVPTDGPRSKQFRPGNAEYVNWQDYEDKQTNQLCGRLQRKIESLNQRHLGTRWKRTI